MASKFEAAFSRGALAGIPQGVAMFERFQERAAAEKERKALARERAEARAEAKATSAEKEQYQRRRDEIEDIYKFGGQDPELIRQGLAQEREPSKFPRLEDSELYQFQKLQAQPGTSTAPMSIYSTPAEQSLSRFRESMAKKNEPYSARYEAKTAADLGLIQARAEAERGLIGARTASQISVKQAPKYKAMGGAAAPAKETAEGATKSWLQGIRQSGKLSETDAAALKWANANPKDPRAAAIKKRLAQ